MNYPVVYGPVDNKPVFITYREDGILYLLSLDENKQPIFLPDLLYRFLAHVYNDKYEALVFIPLPSENRKRVVFQGSILSDFLKDRNNPFYLSVHENTVVLDRNQYVFELDFPPMANRAYWFPYNWTKGNISQRVDNTGPLGSLPRSWSDKITIKDITINLLPLKWYNLDQRSDLTTIILEDNRYIIPQTLQTSQCWSISPTTSYRQGFYCNNAKWGVTLPDLQFPGRRTSPVLNPSPPKRYQHKTIKIETTSKWSWTIFIFVVSFFLLLFILVVIIYKVTG